MPEIPPALLLAFENYERAIATNDLAALDAAFAPGAETMRADSAGLLVGHEAISAFRSTRGGVAERVIERLEYRELTPESAVIVALSRFTGGGTGVQTQLWQLIDGTWLITTAHVTPRAQALDRSIWRSVGDPLWQGAYEGPLAGLTVAVKDLFALKGYRIGAGNPAYLESARVEPSSAPAVVDLLQAGASLRGIARTDEFAYSIAGENPHYGTPPNGAVPGALPGGSSSGPASAVATGQAEVGLATDTAGSIRVPASYQGLWGLRTTHGLVPRQGLLPLAQTFDTVGWLARDGATLQRVADWCLSYDGSESTESVLGESGVELPWSFLVLTEFLDAAEPATREVFQDFLATLTALPGAPSIATVSIGDLASYQEAFRIVQGAEAWRNHGEWIREHPNSLGEGVAGRMRLASEITADQEGAARTEISRLRDGLTQSVARHVLLAPTTPGPAPSRATPQGDALRTATLRMTTPAAVAGLPAISVPLLTVASGLGPAPVGLTLISRAGTDIALVRLARRLAATIDTSRTGSPRSSS